MPSEPTTSSTPQEAPPPHDPRRFTPRSFGLRFEVGELGDDTKGYFVEGTVYVEPGKGASAAGKATTHTATSSEDTLYESIDQLIAALKLSATAAVTLVDRITHVVNQKGNPI